MLCHTTTAGCPELSKRMRVSDVCSYMGRTRILKQENYARETEVAEALSGAGSLFENGSGGRRELRLLLQSQMQIDWKQLEEKEKQLTCSSREH